MTDAKQDRTVENALLGMLIMDSSYIDFVPDEPLWSSELNERIYDEIARRHKAGEKSDLVSLATTVGEASYLSKLLDGILPPTPERVVQSVQFLRQRSRVQLAISHLEAALRAAREGDTESAVIFIDDARNALAGADPNTTGLAHTIRSYLEQIRGEFTLSQLYNDLGLTSTAQKNATRQMVNRLVRTGELTRLGHRAGRYKKPDLECEEIDYINIQPKALDISLPFNLHEYVRIYSGNICAVAGSWDSGKTAFMLDLIKRNMRAWPITLFSSEMGPEELRMRLEKHADLRIEEWKFKALMRADNFGDIIRPDEINVIDYLEISENFWEVDKTMREIHDRLRRGVAFIAIQKSRFQDLGRGGDFGAQKPRLYLTLDRDTGGGVIKVLKAKNIVPGRAIAGKMLKFQLEDGWHFVHNGDWEYPPPPPEKRTVRNYTPIPKLKF